MITLDGRIVNIVQANTGALSFSFYGPNSAKYPLSGHLIRFMVKRYKKDSDDKAVIVKEFGDVQDNTVNVVLYPKDTNIPVGTYWWAIQIIKGDYVNQAASGPFCIMEGVIDNYE